MDRWDRHKLLIWTQAISMVQSFALAGLTLTGHITVSAIIALNAVQGIVNAFDMPARQAFPGQHDRGQGGPRERHRAELVDVQRGASGRAVDRRV